MTGRQLAFRRPRMDDARYQVAGGPNRLITSIEKLLLKTPPACISLVNADNPLHVPTITARCRAFADGRVAGEDSLIVTILTAATPGPVPDEQSQAVAALWAFTRAAALQWAERGVRVNAIGLGASPAGPFEPQEQSGRAAFPAAANPATAEDVARTILAMAAWRSMTGQIIRLGV